MRNLAVMLVLLVAGATLPGAEGAGAGDSAPVPAPVPAAGEDGGPAPGYWLVGPDGGVYAFGGAAFLGSAGNPRLNPPAVGLAPTRIGDRYWLVAADGGLFSFGDATFFGSAAGKADPAGAGRVMAVVPSQTGAGYWELGGDGVVYPFGDAAPYGSAPRKNRGIAGGAGVPTGAGLPPLPGVSPPDGGVPIGGDPTGLTGEALVGPPLPSGKVRPNVLFILVDDARSEGTMDQPGVLPKTRKWLAQGGTTFDEGYSTTSLCC